MVVFFKGDFKTYSAPLFAQGDHNVVFLLPHYKPELKRIKPQIHHASPLVGGRNYTTTGLTGMHRLGYFPG